MKVNAGFQWENPLAKKIQETQEGDLGLDLIREFFEFYRMEYSLQVFCPECAMPNDSKTRREISQRIGIIR